MSPKQSKRLPEWAVPMLGGSAFILAATWCLSAEAPTHEDRHPALVIECPTVVDVRQDGTSTTQAGRAVPAKPEDWMQRAPCRAENDEVEVRGACYMPLERKPPCKPTQYEHAGRCFAAIAKTKRPNTSVDKAVGE